MPNGYNYTIGPGGVFLFSSGAEGVRYFVSTHGPDLITALSGSGIFFATAVAQKCQESAYGTSHAAVAYNNFGGIMYNGVLAQFATPLACFQKYVETLLAPNHKYVIKGLLTAKTPFTQMLAIAQGGYCTDPPASTYYSRITPTIRTVLNMYPLGKIQ